MFGSDTMMKLNIIKNELHNIMKSQLRRVDGEVTALSARIKETDKNLEQSEKYIKTATGALAEAVQWQMENR
jgi:peptidoglycan hydrolase CwlO-like protein